jgi:ADP-ribosylglycohydrolase
MLGAIAGDIIGSVHEFVETKTTDFPLFVAESQFTDDTVLTVAVADCLLTGSSYGDKFHAYARAYPKCGYGSRFLHWVYDGRREAYNSWGNGSAMRVGPVAFAIETLEEVVKQARELPRSHTTIQRAYAGRKRPQRLLFLCDEARPRRRSAISLEISLATT